MNVERDRQRRVKAHAILSRPAPDRRAVKRARRLLKDANRDSRIAANKQWSAALAGLNVGLKQFGNALDRVTTNMRAAAQAFDRFVAPSIFDRFDGLQQIPILPPGDEIRILPMTKDSEQFVAFPMRRAGKVAAQEKEIAELEARGIKTYRLTDLSPRRSLSPSLRSFLDLSDIDKSDPRVIAMQKRVSDRLERSLFARTLGETYTPPPRCKCGVMLYGDSCATCGFEANEPKQSD